MVPSRSARRWSFLVVVAAVAGGVLAGTVMVAWWLRVESIARGHELAEFHARAFDRQVTQTFDVIGLMLAGLAADEQAQAGSPGAAKAFDDALRLAPYLRSAALVGADGRIASSSNPRNVGVAVSREGYVPAGDELSTAQLRIGLPWAGRDFHEGRAIQPGQPAAPAEPGFIPVWRDVLLPDGRIVSVLAAVNGDYFLNFHVGGLDAEADEVALLRHDGIVLLSSDPTRPVGQPGPQDGRGGQAAFGRFTDVPEGGVASLGAFRNARNHPLVTVVRLDQHRALERWREEVATLFAVVLAALAAGGLIAGLHFRGLEAAARERDAAVLALQESERRFRTLLSNLQGLVYRRRDDTTGTVLFASEGVRGLIGIEPGELVGDPRGFDQLLHPDDLPDYRERLRVSVQARRPYDLQYRVRRDDGRWLWVREQGVVVPAGDGAPAWLEGYLADVTARKQAGDASRAAEARHRATLDAMIEAVRVIGFDWRYLYVNEAAARQFNRVREQMLGRSVMELSPGIDRMPWFATLRRAMEARELAATEVEYCDPQGGTRWFEMRVQPVPEGIVVLSVEVTERHLFERSTHEAQLDLERKVAERTAALEVARHDAEQASRAKSAFLAAMSHEIRTPMNGVIGMIDVLLESRLKSSQVEVVKTVRDSAHALLGIVDAVLDFSKIEAGQFEIDAEPMAVEGVVDGVCDTLEPVARQTGVLLTLFTDPAIPAQLVGDALRLRQVLVNLAGNAIKFSADTGRRGRVQVRAGWAGCDNGQERVEFSVADNGIGMDEATVARLFAPFVQADRSTTRRYGGTGLGLSISDRLVRMMGGSIAVRSEAGAGSVFTVRLSFPALHGDELPAPPDHAGFDLQGLRCLVFGDVDGMAADLTVYLQHAGAAVERADDLAAAGRWIAASPPGPWVGVVEDSMLDPLREAATGRPGADAAYVAIGVGLRRRARTRGMDVVGLDRNLMRRTAFLEAVALAAGRLVERAPETVVADVETMPAPLSTDEARSLGKLILIAEDNEINQRVVLKQLALLGLRADVAENGRDAFERWQRGAYALLLTDLHMPQMDGYELSAAIRAAEAGRRRIPIVALTANAMKGEARHCRDAGMDDYLTKPVQLAQLKATLDRWLQPPPPAATRAATPVLDVAVLEALVGSDPAVVADILLNFRSSVARAAEEVRAGAASGRGRVVAAAAHKLKSSARAVGALPLGELCVRLEESAHRGGDEPGVAALLAEFEAEIARVNAALAAR